MDVVIAIIVVIALLAVVGLVVVRRRSAAPTGAGASPPTVPAPGPVEPKPPAERARGEGLGSKVRALFGAGEPTEDVWVRLHDVLLKADVGPATASRIVGDMRARYREGADPEELIADEVVDVLGGDPALDLPEDRLAIVMVVGVNGSGKTTTIGKLAARLVRRGRRVSIAGSDTFRAAASEQLDVWAQRAGAQLVAQERGADPGAVAFDAVQAANARGMDVLIVDTAGRLHTRQPLMDELRKVKRVIEKAAGRVDEVLLVLDATTGQNGIQQARVFTEAVDVTGVALTKLDGTAKGGVVLAVREELGIPVKLVGTGEGVDDLETFQARAFADRLVRG